MVSSRIQPRIHASHVDPQSPDQKNWASTASPPPSVFFVYLPFSPPSFRILRCAVTLPLTALYVYALLNSPVAYGLTPCPPIPPPKSRLKEASSKAAIPPIMTRLIPSLFSSSRWVFPAKSSKCYSANVDQAGIIIIFCRLLHWPLSKIRQPRVIAEVIAGVILGPSVMGRIPGFTDAIFPTASIPNLNLVANLGLVLFLFLVGLETNLRFLVSNWRVAVSVSAAGMILPFGLGCAIAYGLYNTFQDEPDTVDINFGTFLLFIGIAMAITVSRF